MNRFCTACGTTNEVDARFCDHCGQALRPRVAPGPAPAPGPLADGASGGAALPGLSKVGRAGPLVWGALGLTVLLAIGAVVWALLGPGLPSAADQDRIAKAWLARQQEGLLQRACLTNFPYQRNPVALNPFDTQSQAWLDALVDAGVYERRDSQGGSLMYAHGPKAAAHIRGSRLCLASGVEVRELRLEEIPQAKGKAARLHFEVIWTGQPDFAARPPVSEQIGPRVKPRSETLMLVRRDSGWAEGDLSDLAALGGDRKPAASAVAQAGSGPGFLAWLSNLFSFGGGPASVAKDFSLAVTQGRAADALALIHPADRNPTIDAKLAQLIEAQAAQRRASITVDAEVLRQAESEAVVRIQIFSNGELQKNDTLRLRKHEGRWYVRMDL